MPRSERPDEIKILDELIQKYYAMLKRDETNRAILGDVLKMIELKRKLAPTGANQGDFWKMLDAIRRDALGKKNGAKRSGSPKKNPASGKKAT